MSDDWLVRIFTGAVGIVCALIVVALIVYLVTPPPTCPDGYALAGGGYGGRYHCVPGVEPTR